MNREFLALNGKQAAVRIRNTGIEAVRVRDIISKGVRVYKDGKIGIAGSIGDVPDSVLLDNAIDNLSAGIEYPYSLSGNKTDHRDYSAGLMSQEELLGHAESVLDILRREYSDFDFSETISFNEVVLHMHNTEGLDLKHKDAFFSLGLVLNEKKSANLMDGSLSYRGRRFDPEKFWAFNRLFLEANRRRVELPERDILPVFTLGSLAVGFLTDNLNGERYATGSSLFSGKIGRQLFNEKITLEQNRDPRLANQAFFDMEGVVMPDDRCVMIKNGKLINVFTDKRNAALYNLPHTGSASGDIDGIPELAGAPLRFRTDSRNLEEALDGRKAVFVWITSGGDFTPDGTFAAPVQVSFLFDGERLIGKLPEFTIRSHLNKMLGDDYIGTFDNACLYYSDFPTQLQGCYMTIVR
ncbi:MAG: metallopeptidase TldD-related protein [Bacillota bacterium]|jgi:PmbA protein|nr:metallopeptidase TldD-related protein [Bacillota bacterium]HHU30911.1 hypothetical protein [Bacillota bacterium]